jgi:nucleoside-diphosphate-sugar epimerase
MRRILVTGASGFIGRHCLPLFLDRGYEVHAVAREPQKNWRSVDWHQTDLLKTGAASALVEYVRPTHLLHLAWCASPRNYLTNPANSQWTRATAELAEAFIIIGGTRFVAAGSCAEYSRSTAPCQEGETPLGGANRYSQAKAAAFERLSELADCSGLSFAWGRIFFPYGPYQASERLIPAVIASLLQDHVVDCGAGKRVRDFIHVADVATAFAALLDGEVRGACNIGSGRGVSIHDLMNLLARKLGRESLLRLDAHSRSWPETSDIVANVRRLRDEAGWRPSVSLEEGLEATVQWWRAALGR